MGRLLNSTTVNNLRKFPKIISFMEGMHYPCLGGLRIHVDSTRFMYTLYHSVYSNVIPSSISYNWQLLNNYEIYSGKTLMYAGHIAALHLYSVLLIWREPKTLPPPHWLMNFQKKKSCLRARNTTYTSRNRNVCISCQASVHIQNPKAIKDDIQKRGYKQPLSDPESSPTSHRTSHRSLRSRSSFCLS